MKVHQEHGRPATVERGPAAGQDTQERIGRGDRDEDDQGGRRDDPSAAPPVEGQDRCPARGCPFTEQDAGDHEPGDDEEHVDADVAATDHRAAGVEQDDEEDGQGPETLDVGPELAIFRSRPRFVLGRRVTT